MAEKNRNRLTSALFAVYLVALVWVILFKFGRLQLGSLRSINLIPYGQSLVINGRLNYFELIMNVVIFLPLGIYGELLFGRWPNGRKLLAIVALSLSLETLQYILGVGASDISDVLNNTLGGMLGWVLVRVLDRLLKSRAQVERWINGVATVATALAVGMLLLLALRNR